MKKKILVTGSEGMVGTALVNILKLNKKYKILKITKENFDIKDTKKTFKYIQKINPYLIIHCAAKVGGIGDNVNNSISYLIENTSIDNSLIFSAYNAGIKNLIYIGSSCMYPVNSKKPILEKNLSISNLEKTNEGYALAKVFSTKTCEIINKNSSFNYKVIIPCNLFGPNDNFKLKSGHMIPAAIKKIDTAIKNNKKIVEIWGTGKPKREFMYVENLIDFIIILIKKFNDAPNLINVGMGKEYSIKKYYTLIASQLKYSGKFIYNTKKPDGQMSKIIDSTLAKKLGWKPKITLLEGIKKTIKFYKKT